ncbi:hypothetical protein LCGC14_1711680 [marine sediment metagenome]|uniref:Uncharacterized protein n=1 Tax=marine sediment metagenome TaxID=412755 RepID=A0A0F9HFI4_9ZZZZ
MILSQEGIYEGAIEAGLRLADASEDEGGWSEYFSESDEADLRIEDDVIRAHTALMLENTKRWMARKCRKRLDERGRFVIDEVTRSAMVGGFSDYIFPIIRASFPTNPINDLVSVQPTTRRTATIVYWNWIVGRGKGSYYQGMRLFDAQTGKQDAGFHFSDEVIDIEALVTLGGANATISGTLKQNDGGGVRPGTVQVNAEITTGPADVVFSDNGNGEFIDDGSLTISASSMDYKTGVWSITISAETFTTTPVTGTYRWNSEGSRNLAEVDVQIISSTVETERRAILINYSIESMQDIMAEFGVSLEPNLVSGAAEQMNFEIARQIIHELWLAAPVVGTFPITQPSENGYNQQDHFKDLVYVLNQASNNIWKRTQKGYGNWLVVDEGAATVIESLPAGMFVQAPRPANVQGLHFIGTLVGRYRVYKDLHLDKEPGASANGNILMGFKGTQFFEAGFVWSPYQLLYTTDSLTTADFLTQKGMASRYATKMVNNLMYARINLSS